MVGTALCAGCLPCFSPFICSWADARQLSQGAFAFTLDDPVASKLERASVVRLDVWRILLTQLEIFPNVLSDGLPLAAAGGSFLLESRTPEEIFTPEDLNEEQRQIAATAAEFARDEILPRGAALRPRSPDCMRSLLQKAAALGFTSVDIPEEYGGVGMDKTTSTVITDHISVLASFSTAFGGQIGIGTLPLVWYGTEEQKRRYLPKLATAEWIAAYALSEASSGSDAMNIRTRATLSPDGKHYLLNGEKMWITNCGFADLYTVFAKIDGEKFSAFLVERTFPGLTVGAEEHKLGIRGSSTCPLVLQDCRVPVENLLGEPGKGHHIAFNVLNVGRFKLGVACVGGARRALGEMVRYAQRAQGIRQIDRRIRPDPAQDFDRCGAALCRRKHGVPHRGHDRRSDWRNWAHGAPADPRETQRRIEEYAVECSILKVYGSEMLAFVADELVGHHGRLRLCGGVSGRAILSRRPHQPNLRGHQRDQSADHHRLADEARHGRQAGAAAGHQAADGRSDAAALVR